LKSGSSKSINFKDMKMDSKEEYKIFEIIEERKAVLPLTMLSEDDEDLFLRGKDFIMLPVPMIKSNS
jgi:hypothetical protein